MTTAAEGLATLLALLLVFAQPIRGRQRYKWLVQALPSDPSARIRWYRRGIVAEWVVVAVVLVVGLLARAGGDRLALGAGRDPGAAWMIVAEMVVVIPVSAAIYRRRSVGMERLLRAQVGGFRALLPVTSTERWLFVGVALTAGICEELVFRGFGILYVRWLWPGATDVDVAVIVSVVFGLAHLYQGSKGVVITGVLGALFCWLTFQSGSLLPAMIVHALVDLRAAVLPAIPPDDAASSPPVGLVDPRPVPTPWPMSSPRVDHGVGRQSPWTPFWAVDPSGRHELRYWDGTRWTEHVSTAGATGIDPPT